MTTDTCHWDYIGSNTGIDNADEDIAILIDDFLENEWQGTATELSKKLNTLDSKAAISPTTLSKQLRRIDELLQKEFAIKTSFKKSGGTKYRFCVAKIVKLKNKKCKGGFANGKQKNFTCEGQSFNKSQQQKSYL